LAAARLRGLGAALSGVTRQGSYQL
jgi:hypothetical protein